MPKEQWEEEATSRFIAYLQNKNSIAYGVTGRDVPVASGENFDYELTDGQGNKMAVELFRLVESEDEIKQSKAWHKIIGVLKQELLKRNIKGYFVSTPLFFYKKRELNAYVSQKADEIENAIKNNQNKKKFRQGDFEFSKIDDLDTIVFSYSPGVRSIDPKGTALQRFTRHLPKKNKQVAVDNKERVLLVINWAIFVDSDDAIRALTNIDFEQFPNVDKIYYEVRPEQFTLIFDRKIVDAIKNKTIFQNADLEKLLHENLRHLSADKKDEAFNYIREITDKNGNITWLTDESVRENLVRYAEAKLEQSSIDEAFWVVRNLQNDSSPNETGANDPDDPKGEHNYHLRVVRGEDVNIITTVRGHLCWLISRLIVLNKPEYYTELIDIIQRYARESNLYMRVQATFPLVELVRRRRAIKNQDGSPFEWKQEERDFIRNLAFEMLRENVQYPRIMQALLHVFDFLRDVNESEAEEILNLFLDTKQNDVLHDLAALVIYFALFRHKDWPADGLFHQEKFVELFKEQIRKGDKSLRSSMAWHIWKIIKDKILPYEDVREYLPLFWEGGYDPHLTSMCAMIIEELVSIAPADAVGLFKQMVIKVKQELEKETEIKQHWLDSADEVLPLFIDRPEELVTAISDLKALWMKGTYIGDLQKIFGIFRKVAPDRKEWVKKQLKEVYNEMKTANQKLVDINWEN